MMKQKTFKLPKKTITLLEKLKAMANRGENGEREVAQQKINDILKKYELMQIPPAISTIKKRVFKCLDWDQYKNLLLQCIVDTKQDAKMDGNESMKRIYVCLTDDEYKVVNQKMMHYWSEYRKKREDLFTAFVVKNDIGTNGPDKMNAEVKINNIDSIVSFLGIIEENGLTNSLLLSAAKSKK